MSDEGKLFGKLNVDCSKAIPGLTASLESELRGRSGVLGLAQRIGLHLAW